MRKKLKVGSLFAGVGGICLGMMEAENPNYQFEIAWANEVDEFACETYRTNFAHTLIEGDIELVLNPDGVQDKIEKLKNELIGTNKSNKSKILSEIKKLENHFQTGYYYKMQELILKDKIDVLNGGFPCQAFSIAGEQKGFSDDRGNLFLSIIELINQLDKKHGKPRFLLLENVKNLVSHDNGNTYKIIKKKLEECGYIITEKVFNTMDYTHLPQNRERIYIVGFLNQSDYNNFSFFENAEEYKILKTSQDRASEVKCIIEYSYKEDTKYYYTEEKYPHYFMNAENISEPSVEKIINLTSSITDMYQFYQLRRGMYVRKNMSDVCPTLTANMGTGGHNVPLILVSDGIRKLTPAETFKLQGFPVGKGYTLPTHYNNKLYSDSNLYKQAGNAVSVPLVKLISEKILVLL